MARYAKRLEDENADDVVVALKGLEEIPRREGESAMPDIGVILAAVDTARKARMVSIAQAFETRLIFVKCLTCGATATDFVKSGERRVYTCHGIPKRAHYAFGETCGGPMEIVHDVPARDVVGR